MSTTEEQILAKLEAISLTLSKLHIEAQDSKTSLQLLLERFSPPPQRSHAPDPSGS